MESLNAAVVRYDTLRAAVDTRLEDAVSSLSPGRLQEAILHAVDGGKRVRPHITLLSCSAAGGRDLDALDPAVAVELLHSASLVHDDVMDASPLRRRRPTVHTAYGLATALLAGDAMIALAFRALQNPALPRRDRILRLFSDGFVDLCEGQGEDITGCSIERGNGRHREMVEKKTARLIEVAAGAGALVATDNPRVIRALRSYGHSLGMAFQAVDDLLDAVGDTRSTGKPVGADRRNGRTTFVSVAYPDVDPVTAVGNVVERHTERALHALALVPPSPAHDALQTLALSLQHRTG